LNGVVFSENRLRGAIVSGSAASLNTARAIKAEAIVKKRKREVQKTTARDIFHIFCAPEGKQKIQPPQNDTLAEWIF